MKNKKLKQLLNRLSLLASAAKLPVLSEMFRDMGECVGIEVEKFLDPKDGKESPITQPDPPHQSPKKPSKKLPDTLLGFIPPFSVMVDDSQDPTEYVVVDTENSIVETHNMITDAKAVVKALNKAFPPKKKISKKPKKSEIKLRARYLDIK